MRVFRLNFGGRLVILQSFLNIMQIGVGIADLDLPDRTIRLKRGGLEKNVRAPEPNLPAAGN